MDAWDVMPDCRPMNIPLGDAVGKMTPMLRQYIQYFRMKMGEGVTHGGAGD